MTLISFLEGQLKGGKGPAALSREEEEQLVAYLIHMAERGLPVGRKDVKTLAWQINQVCIVRGRERIGN